MLNVVRASLHAIKPQSSGSISGNKILHKKLLKYEVYVFISKNIIFLKFLCKPTLKFMNYEFLKFVFR